MRQPVRVVLADDHDAFVEGLGMVLSAEDDLEIVALAGDGASTLQAVRTHHPDVLVVDTEMPGPAVSELVRLVGQADPATRVLLLAEDARPHPTPAVHNGMSRAASARELAEAIRAVAAGFQVVMADPPTPGPAGPAGQARQAWQASPQPRDGGAPEREGNRRPGGVPGAVHSPERPERDLHAELLLRSLSDRERQVLDLLARGYSNRRIAEACYLSLNTVRTHVQNVLVKLGVHSKLEAAALAVRQGLVQIEDHPA
ncbi:MAG TPA: response regulator transcription factor [Actinomycetota bacterium]|nr:response regulator transcription factor [Actinomycetota bacterium]